MRKMMLLVVFVLPVIVYGQLGIGIKAGLNFANVTNASSINGSSSTGFLAGLFLAPKSKGIISSRTELIFSRQGYNFKSNTNTGNVNLDYILLPQLMSINITRFVSIQVGAQMAVLLNAKADSTTNPGIPGLPPQYAKVMDYYNKFDYGFAGGIEIHPVSGLLIGARYNISLGDVYSDPNNYSNGGSAPSFIPKVNGKNNVVQIFAGWIFGGGNSSKKKQDKKSQQ